MPVFDVFNKTVSYKLIPPAISTSMSIYGRLRAQYWVYTVNHKKRDILFLTITLDNLKTDFFEFLYHFNLEEIIHATVVKFTTSP